MKKQSLFLASAGTIALVASAALGGGCATTKQAAPADAKAGETSCGGEKGTEGSCGGAQKEEGKTSEDSCGEGSCGGKK